MSESNTSPKAYSDLCEYCDYFNLPLKHIVEALRALKVIPMVRGICFEFSVIDKLKAVLPSDEWSVENPTINAQSAIQDIDVLVIHKKTGKKIVVECKLTGKNSFRVIDGKAIVKVKCMRSRTVGPEAAKDLAKRYGVTPEEVLRHRDNYRADDFDFVITSLGNAFWRTNKEKDGMYEFSPTKQETAFLRTFFNDKNATVDELKKKTFDYMVIARAPKIVVSPENGVECVRRACIQANTQKSCGFVPNYPLIPLTDHSVWKPVEKAEEMFKEFIS